MTRETQFIIQKLIDWDVLMHRLSRTRAHCVPERPTSPNCRRFFGINVGLFGVVYFGI